MIKYILFDLDGTLLDFSKSEKKIIKKVIKDYANYELSIDDLNYFSKINEYWFNRFNDGYMTRIEYQIKRFDEFKKYLKLEFDIESCNKYYCDNLKIAADLYDDIDILNYLYNKYDLFIASNGMLETQKNRLSEAKIYNYFKDYYVSEKIGYNKPDIKFFEYIFNDLNDYNKENYVIIGDRISTDIIGGKNAGIKTIYLNRLNIKDTNKISDYEIKSLNELKNIL